MKKAHLFLVLLCSVFIYNIHSQNAEKEQQAILLYEDKELDQSKALFEEVLKEQPNNANVQEYLANIAFDEKKYELAAQKIKVLVDRFPGIARYHFKYAGAIGLYATNNKIKGVFLVNDIKKHFHKAVELDANFVDGYLGLVHMYLKLPVIFGGNKEKAIFYANKVKALDKEKGNQAMELIEKAT